MGSCCAGCGYFIDPRATSRLSIDEAPLGGEFWVDWEASTATRICVGLLVAAVASTQNRYSLEEKTTNSGALASIFDAKLTIEDAPPPSSKLESGGNCVTSKDFTRICRVFVVEDISAQVDTNRFLNSMALGGPAFCAESLLNPLPLSTLTLFCRNTRVCWQTAQLLLCTRSTLRSLPPQRRTRGRHCLSRRSASMLVLPHQLTEQEH